MNEHYAERPAAADPRANPVMSERRMVRANIELGAPRCPLARLLVLEGIAHELPRAVWNVVVPAILEQTSAPTLSTGQDL